MRVPRGSLQSVETVAVPATANNCGRLRSLTGNRYGRLHITELTGHRRATAETSQPDSAGSFPSPAPSNPRATTATYKHTDVRHVINLLAGIGATLRGVTRRRAKCSAGMTATSMLLHAISTSHSRSDTGAGMYQMRSRALRPDRSKARITRTSGARGQER
jgi:hypothetical protein